MKRPIVKITLFFFRVLMGVSDAVLPNIKNSIKENYKCPVTKKNEVKIDYARFTATALTFLFLILNFFGLITVEELHQVLKIFGK